MHGVIHEAGCGPASCTGFPTSFVSKPRFNYGRPVKVTGCADLYLTGGKRGDESPWRATGDQFTNAMSDSRSGDGKSCRDKNAYPLLLCDLTLVSLFPIHF